MRGIVLEGGGTRGVYQVGAWKALRELGIEFDGVSGCSIGAINGVFMAMDKYDELEKLWLKSDFDDFLDIDEDDYEVMKDLDYTIDKLPELSETIIKAIEEGGFDTEPIKEILKDNVDEDLLERLGRDFFITVTSIGLEGGLEYRSVKEMKRGDVARNVMSSANLPIFKPMMDEKGLLLDGAFHDNLPIGPLDKEGYDEIVVIRVNTETLSQLIPRAGDAKDAKIIEIVPSRPLGGLFNFDKDHIREIFKLGYLDAMKTYGKFFGNRYFFSADDDVDEINCIRRLASIDQESVDLLAAIMDFENTIPKERLMLELIVPEAAEMFGLKEDFTYREFLTSLYERRLEDQGLNELNIYDFDKTVEAIEKTTAISKEKKEKLKEGFEKFHFLKAAMIKGTEQGTSKNISNVASIIIEGIKSDK